MNRTIPPRAQLDVLMSVAVSYARSTVPRFEMVQPIAHVLGPGDAPDQGIVVPLDPRQSEKNNGVVLLRRLCLERQATAVVVVREAWSAEGPPEDPDLQRVLRGEIGVKDLPSNLRRDALIVVGECLPRVQRSLTYLVSGAHPGRTMEETPISDLDSERDPRQYVDTAWYPLLPMNAINERLRGRRN